MEEPVAKQRQFTGTGSPSLTIPEALTIAEIWAWQEEMYLSSAYLYSEGYEAILEDPSYDQLCQMLLRFYDTDCSPEFKQRVDKGNLSTGTTVGLSFTEADRDKAFEWYRRVRGREPVRLDRA